MPDTQKSGAQDNHIASYSVQVALERLFAISVDGRTAGIRYRQDQLQRLHRGLSAHVDEIGEALRKDTGSTAVECDVEFATALATVRTQYNELDFDKSLNNEYKVARGEGNPARRVGVGAVYIKPAKATPFFSIVAPLSAAIAAGNCVVIELKQNLLLLNQVLRGLLQKSLDGESFAIIDDEIKDEHLLSKTLQVIQDTVASPAIINLQDLVSPSSDRVVAVVDRTADIASAAEQLVRARFAFNGKAAYAPDVVLVNEFVKKRFLEAAVREALNYTTGYSDSDATDSAGRLKQERPLKELAADFEGGNIVSLASRGGILEVTSRSSAALQYKLNQPLLLVLSVTSLDDAIDFSYSKSRLLATHVFGNGATVKYLSQFINARASFINQIPVEVLGMLNNLKTVDWIEHRLTRGTVGPAGPLGHPLSITLRYTRRMFEVPFPQFTLEKDHNKDLASCLTGTAAVASITAKLISEACAPLKPTGQSTNPHVGFFEQGLVTGMALFGLPVLLGCGWATYYLARTFIIPVRLI